MLFNGHLCPKKTGECTAFSGFFVAVLLRSCARVDRGAVFSQYISVPLFLPFWNVYKEILPGKTSHIYILSFGSRDGWDAYAGLSSRRPAIPCAAFPDIEAIP